VISLESNVIDSLEDENHASMNHTVQLHSTAHGAHPHSNHNGHHHQVNSNFDIETETNLSDNSDTNFYENIERGFYQKQMEILAGEKFYLRASKFTNNNSININSNNLNQIGKNILIDSIKSTNRKAKIKHNL
jgi:spore maturation protein CgeB